MTTEPSSDFELEIGPVWDPLLGDPRFDKSVALLAPKDGNSK
ncbi:MAG: hypothetical protein WCC93_03585 [Chthoniobacterales bacterium]